MLIEMLMPKMGESVMEGTILNWLKKIGDTIKQDEPVLEVATDKVDTEIPATHGGILKEILVQVGQVVQIGKTIAIIATSESDHASSNVSVVKKEVEIQSSVNENRFYSPLVLNIAKEEKISMTDLEKIAGTGKDGRLTKNDLLDYLAKRTQNPVTETLEVVEIKQEKATEIAKVEPVQSTNKPAVSYSGSSQGRVEVMEMDRMRKMIAQRMVESKHTSPHVTSFVEADVTGIVNWRKAKVEAFKKKEGINLTYTPIFIWAVVKAIKDFPLINSSIDGDKILIKKDINIGVAVALPSGNLIVPVIKNAEHLNLSGLAIKIDDLAKRARENKLSPDELSGGTYTVSNIGSFGNLMGTPIILQPQVAILSLGAIVKKPAVIETPEGDLIGIRQKMFLSHSYDHRIIDGALGGMFVRKVADYLEQFDVKQSI